jgi:hypothetical protein
VAAFTIWKNRVAELEHGALVAGAMAGVTIRAAKKGNWFWIQVRFVVHVIRKPRLANALLVTFQARFVLQWQDDRRGLLQKTGVSFERVARGIRQDLRPPDRAFAGVALDAANLLLAKVKRREIFC